MRMRLVSLASILAALGVASTKAQDSGGASAEDLRTFNSGGASAEDLLTFTTLAGPLPLFPGQVTNTKHRFAIPPGPIAISEIRADVVEKDPWTGAVVPVPLSEAYMHHHVLYGEHSAGKSNGRRKRSVIGRSTGPIPDPKVIRAVGFGPGTESRGTPQKFPHPFRFTTVAGEDSFVANVHVINTRAMTTQQAHRCLECPCTAEDHEFKDGVETSTVKKSLFSEQHYRLGCNDALVEEENDSCFPEKYRGGIHCCHDGEFCLDDYFLTNERKLADNGTQSIFYLRYSFTYAPPTPEVRPLGLAACCDATGDEKRSGNVEYDIPKCADDNDDCVHELETVLPIHRLRGGEWEGDDAYLDLVYMVGHMHRGGLNVSAHLMDGTPLCVSVPTYGTGAPAEIGNEPGYINSMSECTFDPPLRMKTTDRVRVVGRYSAKVARTGVMSLFYIAIADAAETAQESQEPKKPFRSFAISFLLFCLGYAVATARSSLAARPTPTGPGKEATRSAACDEEEARSLVAPGPPSKDQGVAVEVKSPHLPAGDGARGIGVALVILYHMGYETFENAWFCISLFFGLSGFLITKNTVESLERNGEVHVLKFWAKRVSRLFPALLATVVAIVLSQRLPWRVDDGITFQREKVDLMYAVAFLTNYNIVYNQVDAYFDEFSSPSVTRHLWTLSIEEQYYVIWPLVLWTLTTAVRKFGRGAGSGGRGTGSGLPRGASHDYVRGCLKAIMALDLLVIAGSFVSAHATIDKMGMSAAYVSTWCRMGDIAAGGLVYTTVRLVPYLEARFLGDPSLPPMGTKEQVLWELPTAFTLLLELGTPALPVPVADMLVFYFAGGRLVLSLAIFAVVSQAVLATAAGGVPRWAVASRAFTLGPMQTLGVISYGVYVFHWPLIIYFGDPRGAARRFDPDNAGGFPYHTKNAFLFAGVCVLGYLSFFGYELPAMAMSRRTKPRRTVAAGILAMVATLGFVKLATIDLPPMVTFDEEVNPDLAVAPFAPPQVDPRFTPLFFYGDQRVMKDLYMNVLDYNTRTNVINAHFKEFNVTNILNRYTEFKDDAAAAVIVVCRNFGVWKSPCDESRKWRMNNLTSAKQGNLRNGTHWLWLRSKAVCGEREETVPESSAQRRCDDFISVDEMYFNAPEWAEAKFEFVMAIDEKIPGVLNQNTISRMKQRNDDTTDVQNRERWNPIKILVLGESVGQRIAMFWKDYVNIDLPLLMPSTHSGLKIEDNTIPQYPSIITFLCLEAPKYNMCSWEGAKRITTSISKTKPDVVVVHDTHFFRGDNRTGFPQTGFHLPEFEDLALTSFHLRLLAWNIMLREAEEAGVEGVFYLTQSPSFDLKKADRSYDKELQQFMRFIDVLACKGGGASPGIRLTVVDWARLVCPYLPTAGTCSQKAHGFRSILPDGRHPYGDSGLWLARETLAVVMDEIHRHLLPGANVTGDTWTNPVTAQLLALAPPDRDPPLADLVSSYYVCPFDKAEELRAAFESADVQDYANYRDSENYVE